jgi:hypothetical protein
MLFSFLAKTVGDVYFLLFLGAYSILMCVILKLFEISSLLCVVSRQISKAEIQWNTSPFGLRCS